MKRNLALVAGGYSGEYDISVQSAITIENNIDTDKYTVYKIIITRANWTYTDTHGNEYAIDKNNFTLLINNEIISFDGVFIGIHGTPGEDGKLQGYFEMLGIPFTGCGAIVSGITFNKIFCNRIVSTANITNVARSVHIFKDRPLSPDQILSQLKLPVFVKPAEGGSSLGTTKVKDAALLQAAIDAAFEHDTQVMAEEFVKGREFSIGVYKSNNKIYALPVTEIISKKEFFDYEAKYQGASEEVTPAAIDSSLAYRIADTAERVYELLNCRGIVRVDFIHETDSDKLYFLEINTMPGQSENSIVPQQVRAAGMTLKSFYNQIIDTCFA